MTLTLVENFRALFYMPFYVLKERGDAEAEGLEVEWIAANTPGEGVEVVKRGGADLTWGGPMRIMKDHDTQPLGPASLVGFCEVVGRDPFYLVGSRSLLPFALDQLPARRLSVVSEVPTPWLCLQTDLADNGLDVAAYLAHGDIVATRTFEEQITALESGHAEVIQLFEPYVSRLELESGRAVLARAADRGPTVYTVFITTRARHAEKTAEFAALTRAMARTQQWMLSHSDSIYELCGQYFPDIDAQIARRSIRRYIEDGVWSVSPTVSQGGFEALSRCLHNGGFIRSPGKYSLCITSF